MDTYTGKIGLLKVREPNINGNMITSCLGRLQIPAAALEEIGLKAGDKYAVKTGENDGEIVIFRTSNAKSKRVSEPHSVRFERYHFLEFSGGTCRIAAQDLDLTDIEFFVRDGQLIGQLPVAVLTTHSQEVARRRKEAKDAKRASKCHDFREVINGLRGAAAAVALDAWRYDMKERPTNVEHVLWVLREEGHRVSQISERLWRLDDVTANLGDLSELAQKYEGGLVLVAA